MLKLIASSLLIVAAQASGAAPTADAKSPGSDFVVAPCARPLWLQVTDRSADGGPRSAIFRGCARDLFVLAPEQPDDPVLGLRDAGVDDHNGSLRLAAAREDGGYLRSGLVGADGWERRLTDQWDSEPPLFARVYEFEVEHALTVRGHGPCLAVATEVARAAGLAVSGLEDARDAECDFGHMVAGAEEILRKIADATTDGGVLFSEGKVAFLADAPRAPALAQAKRMVDRRSRLLDNGQQQLADGDAASAEASLSEARALLDQSPAAGLEERSRALLLLTDALLRQEKADAAGEVLAQLASFVDRPEARYQLPLIAALDAAGYLLETPQLGAAQRLMDWTKERLERRPIAAVVDQRLYLDSLTMLMTVQRNDLERARRLQTSLAPRIERRVAAMRDVPVEQQPDAWWRMALQAARTMELFAAAHFGGDDAERYYEASARYYAALGDRYTDYWLGVQDARIDNARERRDYSRVDDVASTISCGPMLPECIDTLHWRITARIISNGNLEAAEALYSIAIEETVAASGPGFEGAAQAWHELAVLQRAAGRDATAAERARGALSEGDTPRRSAVVSRVFEEVQRGDLTAANEAAGVQNLMLGILLVADGAAGDDRAPIARTALERALAVFAPIDPTRAKRCREGLAALDRGTTQAGTP